MSFLSPWWFFAQQTVRQPFELLDQRSRLTVVAGLLVVVLIRILLALMVWAGGRFTRRVMRGTQIKKRPRQ